MSADHLVHESGLIPPRATEIEGGAYLCSAGHDSEADSELRKQSGIYAANIEVVAKLARFYAACTPPDEEFRSIKERINAARKELPDKQKDAHLTPAELRTEIRSPEVAYDPYYAHNAFDQRTKTSQAGSDFSASTRVAPRLSGLKGRFVSAGALVRVRISEVAFFSFGAAVALTICWHSREAREIVSHWTLAMDRSLSVSTSKSPSTLATYSELRRRSAAPPEIAATQHSDDIQSSSCAIHSGALEFHTSELLPTGVEVQGE